MIAVSACSFSSFCLISPSLKLWLRGAVHFLAGWQVLISQLQCSPGTRHSQSSGPDLFCLVGFCQAFRVEKLLRLESLTVKCMLIHSFLRDTKGFPHNLAMLVLLNKIWLKFTFLLNVFPLTSVTTGKYCFVKHIFIQSQRTILGVPLRCLHSFHCFYTSYQRPCILVWVSDVMRERSSNTELF